jgi:NAD+ synthase (glutamine-hydrolysing)
MKIGLAQMRVLPGRPEKNFRAMEEFVRRALDEGCDLVAFPEMCLGGYLVGDLWLDDSFCADLMGYNEALRELSRSIGLVYGNVYVDQTKKNKDGRSRKYNAAYAWSQGRPMPRVRSVNLPEGIAVKTLLPNYRIFDDERYFYSLLEESTDQGLSLESLLVPFAFSARGRTVRFGLEICEDLWFNDYAYDTRPLNVSRLLIENGAEAIVNISSSPWTYGKDGARDRRIRDAAADCPRFVPFYYVNCVGLQNNGKNFVTFDGDSTVYNEKAEAICEASEPYGETLLTHSLPPADSLPCAQRVAPPKPRAHLAAALEAIRGLDDIMGHSCFPYIVGLSGGVDSAVVACLCALAVGKERVRLFSLPSRYSSEQTKGVAVHVAAKLGIALEVIPIEPLVAANAALLGKFAPDELQTENIQAKIRGTSVLSNIAGILGGVMTNNGNKVEIAIGYATLYGDVNGAIAPIGDLLKTEVFDLARYLNETVFKDEVIPAVLFPDPDFNFHLPPTAELKADQRDPMKWGYHDALVRVLTDYRRRDPETILRWYKEGTLAANLEISPALLTRYGLDDPAVFVADLEWVMVGFRRAVFKRIQAPPIVIMSRGSFGFDVRESQLPLEYTRAYRALRRELIGS